MFNQITVTVAGRNIEVLPSTSIPGYGMAYISRGEATKLTGKWYSDAEYAIRLDGKHASLVRVINGGYTAEIRKLTNDDGKISA